MNQSTLGTIHMGRENMQLHAEILLTRNVIEDLRAVR